MKQFWETQIECKNHADVVKAIKDRMIEMQEFINKDEGIFLAVNATCKTFIKLYKEKNPNNRKLSFFTDSTPENSHLIHDDLHSMLKLYKGLFGCNLIKIPENFKVNDRNIPQNFQDEPLFVNNSKYFYKQVQTEISTEEDKLKTRFPKKVMKDEEEEIEKEDKDEDEDEGHPDVLDPEDRAKFEIQKIEIKDEHKPDSGDPRSPRRRRFENDDANIENDLAIAELKKENDHLMARVQRLTSDNRNGSNAYLALRGEIEQLRAIQPLAITNNVKNEEEDVKDVKAEEDYKALLRDYNEKMTFWRDAENRAEQLRVRNEELEQNILSFQTHNISGNNRISELERNQAQFSSLQTQGNTHIAELERINRTLQGDLSDLRDSSAKDALRITKLQNMNSELNKSMQNGIFYTSNLEAEIEKLKTDYGVLKANSAQKLNEEIEKRDAEIKKHTETLQNRDEEIAKYKQASQQNENEISSRIQRLEQLAKSSENEKAKVEVSLEDLLKEYNGLKSSFDEISKKSQNVLKLTMDKETATGGSGSSPPPSNGSNQTNASSRRSSETGKTDNLSFASFNTYGTPSFNSSENTLNSSFVSANSYDTPSNYPSSSSSHITDIFEKANEKGSHTMYPYRKINHRVPSALEQYAIYKKDKNTFFIKR
jgi:hypothetical protein